MKVNAEKKSQNSSIPTEEYTKAMNFIGQNLLSALVQGMQNLPQALRNNEVAIQGLAAFLSNVIHKQFSEDEASRQKALERIMKIVSAQIANIEQTS